MDYKYKKGFTLLEILVAITIFSIAIALASYSFRQSINIVRYINFSYAEDLQKISKLRDSIESTLYFLSQDDTKINDPQKVFKFFFKGNSSSLEYITCKPLIIKNREIVLTRLRKEKDNFIIEEYPIYDKNMNYKQPSFKDITPKKEIIIKDISVLEISYIDNDNEIPFIQDKIPSGIKIQIKKKNEKNTFTMFFKIKSNALIKKELGDSVYESY